MHWMANIIIWFFCSLWKIISIGKLPKIHYNIFSLCIFAPLIEKLKSVYFYAYYNFFLLFYFHCEWKICWELSSGGLAVEWIEWQIMLGNTPTFYNDGNLITGIWPIFRLWYKTSNHSYLKKPKKFYFFAWNALKEISERWINWWVERMRKIDEWKGKEFLLVKENSSKKWAIKRLLVFYFTKVGKYISDLMKIKIKV